MSFASIISGSLIIIMVLGIMGIVNLPYWGWMIRAFFLGFISSGESVPYGFILQSETPKQIMGRVSAVTHLYNFLCLLHQLWDLFLPFGLEFQSSLWEQEGNLLIG
ncbi:hypothetical protein B8W99_28205 [Peribacillus simplex]|nr:hypothetical protein [Listeria monocytogenes]PAK99631.1 hypothetical protein B8W99_28205 [Peribacillus simplex]